MSRLSSPPCYRGELENRSSATLRGGYEAMEASAIGTVSVWAETRRKQRCRHRVVKVSHHGNKWQRWRPFARHWWEQNVGPIPEGYRVIHKDGNALNDEPGNLVLSRSDYWKHIFAAIPGAAERRQKRQPAAVSKSNRSRSRVDLARTSARGWYVVLPDSRAIVWLPCTTAREAAQLLTTAELVALCQDNAIRVASHKCRQYVPGDRVTIARGRQILDGSEIDGAFCGFIRLIPDTRRPPRKRGQTPAAADLEPASTQK